MHAYIRTLHTYAHTHTYIQTNILFVRKYKWRSIQLSRAGAWRHCRDGRRDEYQRHDSYIEVYIQRHTEWRSYIYMCIHADRIHIHTTHTYISTYMHTSDSQTSTQARLLWDIRFTQSAWQAPWARRFCGWGTYASCKGLLFVVWCSWTVWRCWEVCLYVCTCVYVCIHVYVVCMCVVYVFSMCMNVHVRPTNIRVYFYRNRAAVRCIVYLWTRLTIFRKRLYTCMPVNMCVYVSCTCIRTHVYTYVYIYMCVYVYTYSYTHTYAYAFASSFAYAHLCIIYTHTNLHTYIQTYIHHIYIRI